MDHIILDMYLKRNGDGGIIYKIVNRYVINDIGDIHIVNDYILEIPDNIGFVLEDLKIGRINIGFANIHKDIYLGDNKDYDYHSNALIFEHNESGWICTRFEPRGYGTKLYNVAKVDEVLYDFFQKNNIKYHSPLKYQSENGPQYINGLCTAHVLQFIAEYAKIYDRANVSFFSINKTLFGKNIFDFIHNDLF